MEFLYEIFTPIMGQAEFLAEVDKTIQLLKKHGVSIVALMYGWSWGEWEWMAPVQVNDLMTEIRIQELQSQRRFGQNDVYVAISQYDIELLFCHEADIHLSFNNGNPLALEIMNSWIDKGMIHTVSTCRKVISVDELMASL